MEIIVGASEGTRFVSGQYLLFIFPVGVKYILNSVQLSLAQLCSSLSEFQKPRASFRSDSSTLQKSKDNRLKEVWSLPFPPLMFGCIKLWKFLFMKLTIWNILIMGFLFLRSRKKQLKVSSIQAGSLPQGCYFLYNRDEESLSTEKRWIRTNQSTIQGWHRQ